MDDYSKKLFDSIPDKDGYFVNSMLMLPQNVRRGLLIKLIYDIESSGGKLPSELDGKSKDEIADLIWEVIRKSVYKDGKDNLTV